MTDVRVVHFVYESDFDRNGVLYYIGTAGGQHEFTSPAESFRVGVTVIPNSPFDCNPLRATSRENIRVEVFGPDAFISLDLGVSRRLLCSEYSLRHPHGDTDAQIRNWAFEGSNDAQHWSLLCAHDADASLQGAYSSRTWSVECSAPPVEHGPYRFFRVRATGRDSLGGRRLCLGGVELYGTLFENGKPDSLLCGCCSSMTDVLRVCAPSTDSVPFVPSRDVIAPFSSQLKIHARLLGRYWASLPPKGTIGAPAAEVFLGDVQYGADTIWCEQVVAKVRARGWVSAGTFLSPGEPLTLELEANSWSQIGAGWMLRIGCHVDQLWAREHLHRWPSVHTAHSLESHSVTVEVASPYGGLVFFDPANASGPLRARISGGVKVPTFDILTDTKDTWHKNRMAPAPWAEWIGRQISLSLPSSAARLVEDPSTVLHFWDEVVCAMATLAYIPLSEAFERIVVDVQTDDPLRAEHGGYPVVTLPHEQFLKSSYYWRSLLKGEMDMQTMISMVNIINMDTLSKSGHSGLFYALAENFQHKSWVFSGGFWALCQLFVGYAMCKVVTGGQSIWHATRHEAKRRAEQFLLGDGAFSRWKEDKWIALGFFATLQDYFGWQPYELVFHWYRTHAGADISEQKKYDWWLILLSRACGQNLRPYFVRWAVPISSAMVNHPTVQALPVLAPSRVLPETGVSTRESVAEVEATQPVLDSVSENPGKMFHRVQAGKIKYRCTVRPRVKGVGVDGFGWEDGSTMALTKLANMRLGKQTRQIYQRQFTQGEDRYLLYGTSTLCDPTARSVCVWNKGSRPQLTFDLGAEYSLRLIKVGCPVLNHRAYCGSATPVVSFISTVKLSAGFAKQPWDEDEADMRSIAWGKIAPTAWEATVRAHPSGPLSDREYWCIEIDLRAHDSDGNESEENSVPGNNTDANQTELQAWLSGRLDHLKTDGVDDVDLFDVISSDDDVDVSSDEETTFSVRRRGGDGAGATDNDANTWNLGEWEDCKDVAASSAVPKPPTRIGKRERMDRAARQKQRRAAKVKAQGIATRYVCIQLGGACLADTPGVAIDQFAFYAKTTGFDDDDIPIEPTEDEKADAVMEDPRWADRVRHAVKREGVNDEYLMAVLLQLGEGSSCQRASAARLLRHGRVTAERMSCLESAGVGRLLLWGMQKARKEQSILGPSALSYLEELAATTSRLALLSLRIRKEVVDWGGVGIIVSMFNESSPWHIPICLAILCERRKGVTSEEQENAAFDRRMRRITRKFRGEEVGSDSDSNSSDSDDSERSTVCSSSATKKSESTSRGFLSQEREYSVRCRVIDVINASTAELVTIVYVISDYSICNVSLVDMMTVSIIDAYSLAECLSDERKRIITKTTT
eukprot:Rmarinus@m.4630